MPAPGPPRVPPRVAAMVIRSQRVLPDGMSSGWAAAVVWVSVTAWPVAVVTTRRVATGRGTSSSRRIVTGPDRFSGRSKLIWIHCPSASEVASVQALSGSPSKALSGSACGSSQSQDPAEDAVTLAAPVSTATV